ncbi:MAG: hypothetical protein KJ556_20245 [Gammaproteobacteria bacterium]|nr:hypothetical protein [Gammaproteobacteria bacterium]
MEIQDDRTKEQMETHIWLVIGTDRFLSGWGQAKNGSSYAAWACKMEDAPKVLNWVENRGDQLRVRETVCRPGARYRPNPAYCAHLHIYVVDGNHTSL